MSAVAEVCGVSASALPWGVDGCSAANPAMPLSAMARGFSRLAQARTGSADARERALATIRRAMAEHPNLVAGQGRFCTDLMAATRGEVVAKVGAEGLECLALARTGEGVALKVKDGARRAVAPAVIAFLRDRGHLSPAAETALERWARPAVRNHRGIVVGEIRSARKPVPVAATARVP
jgi:L-asparaginase II